MAAKYFTEPFRNEELDALRALNPGFSPVSCPRAANP
jgi:hypothetical protein